VMESTVAPSAFAAWRAQYSGSVIRGTVYTIRLIANGSVERLRWMRCLRVVLAATF
jgi:hypothetical protein